MERGLIGGMFENVFKHGSFTHLEQIHVSAAYKAKKIFGRCKKTL